MLRTQQMRTPHKLVGGVPVAQVSERELVAHMIEDCARRRAGRLDRPVAVFDCNGQTLSMNARDPAYASALAQADLIHADGQFIVWASRFTRGAPVPERTATTDLIHAAARAARARRLRFFLLGGSERLNRRCAEELARQYPGLEIAGRRHGYFEADREGEVVAAINRSNADIVWVGLGKPLEQVFVARNRERLDCAWIVTCGGCFNFVVGDYARAPGWMQSAGLEWLHRMATGPRYLLSRYLFTVPHAMGLVLGQYLSGQLQQQEQNYDRQG